MLKFVIRRCLAAIPLLLLVSVFTFALIRLVPGDPVEVMLGASEKDMDARQIQLIRHEMGLDQPIVMQYWSWVSGWWGEGELGRSYRDGRPVLEVIGERIPTTLVLVGTALVLSFCAGMCSGLLMASLSWTARGQPLASTLSAFALFLYSAPGFWLAFFLMLLVIRNGLPFPVLGDHSPGHAYSVTDVLQHLFLPALVLAARRGAKVALFVKALALEEMRSDYVLTALAKGLSRNTVLLKHILKNSLVPVISLLGLSLPSLFGGSVLIETVFGWPGMGRLLVDATFGRNYPILLALVMLYAVLVIVANLLADLVASLIDPRSREMQSEKDDAGGRLKVEAA